MRAAHRIARVLAERAARRWPEDLAEELAAEWRAELEALRTEPGVPAARRAARALAFAGSLAVSPAVEPAGAEAVSRLETWASSLAGAAGVALLAGALFNGVHAVEHRAGVAFALGTLLLAAAVVALVARRAAAPVLPRATAIAAALFAFLLAGNRTAVMPFMGWRDILPAVLTWLPFTALIARTTHRLAGRGRSVLAALVAVGGGVAALDLATIAGSAHAAATLGVGFRSTPAWFPLALLPAGAHPPAERLLLGNASAMTGPMLLCSVFVLACAWPGVARRPARARTAVGVAATLSALAAGELFRRMPAGALAIRLQRVMDNSATFGFGFLAHTPGLVLTALAAGLLGARLGALRRTPRRIDPTAEAPGGPGLGRLEDLRQHRRSRR